MSLSRDVELEELHGVVKVLVLAARKDKKMIKQDSAIALGEEVAAFIPHIAPSRGDFRRFLLRNEIEAESLRLALKGYKVKLALTVGARALIMDMLITDKFTSLQIPERLPTLFIERFGKGR